jgi:trimethylamine--corrinoid protein Co-methyltransferase
VTSARLEVWNRDDCRQVHHASLSVLAETGVEIKHAAARDLLAAAGAKVEGTRVRIGADIIAAAIAAAPTHFQIKPRPACAGKAGADGAAHAGSAAGASAALPLAPLEMKLGHTYFGTGPDCLYTRDADTGKRRRARLADVEGMAALCEKLPNIDFVMSMGLPEDVTSDIDDVSQFGAMLAGTRKPIVISSAHDGAPLRTMRAMAALCGEAESFACLTMASPPLSHDHEAIDKAIVCAELGLPLVLAPAPSAGTTGPSSIAGCVVVGNAEVLAGLAVHQLAKPGAPFVYGTGMGAMNMRTAVDAYVVPESFLGLQAARDLAFHYGLPCWSYAACSDSKMLDEQYALEVGITTMLGALSRATLLHDVGYLETGMQSAAAGIVLGDEVAGFARAFLKDVATDEETLAVGEINAVGPGGNHLSRPYTRKHHRGFWHPSLIDQTVYDRWHAAGATTLRQRLDARTIELRAEARTHVLDDDVRAALAQLIDGHRA